MSYIYSSVKKWNILAIVAADVFFPKFFKSYSYSSESEKWNPRLKAVKILKRSTEWVLIE